MLAPEPKLSSYEDLLPALPLPTLRNSINVVSLIDWLIDLLHFTISVPRINGASSLKGRFRSFESSSDWFYGKRRTKGYLFNFSIFFYKSFRFTAICGYTHVSMPTGCLIFGSNMRICMVVYRWRFVITRTTWTQLNPLQIHSSIGVLDTINPAKATPCARAAFSCWTSGQQLLAIRNQSLKVRVV